MDAIIDLIPPKIAAHIPGLDTSAYVYALGSDLIDPSKRSFWLSIASIVFNPLYWNITARNEYRNKTLNKIFGGPKGATYFFFVTIFSLGILRDYLYERALSEQPHFAVLAHPGFKALGVALFLAGQLFVVTSIYALGLTGTYLGDYCGILMSHRVTCFPFNVLEDPMYVGSTMAFLGTAIWCESFAGIFLSSLVWFVYAIALQFEGPFTAKIYENAAEDKKRADAKAVADKGAVAPSTPPRKSERAAVPATATSTAALPEATNGAQTPRRRQPRKSAVVAAENIAASSPMRVTRSRSKARSSSEASD